eukprot:s160_g17.t1
MATFSENSLDDYSLDGKAATKNEVFNLLESAGFTKSNPYYIVQQGKVAELTLMDDRRRLELLKEISGASVYDERREESASVKSAFATSFYQYTSIQLACRSTGGRE